MMAKRRRRGIDPMIAMINVVFLLLAFFMIGEFSEPMPFAIDLPVAQSGIEFDYQNVIFISRNGEIESAVDLAEISGPTLIMADGALPANDLISMLKDLRAQGVFISSVEVQK